MGTQSLRIPGVEVGYFGARSEAGQIKRGGQDNEHDRGNGSVDGNGLLYKRVVRGEYVGCDHINCWNRDEKVLPGVER